MLCRSQLVLLVLVVAFQPSNPFSITAVSFRLLHLGKANSQPATLPQAFSVAVRCSGSSLRDSERADFTPREPIGRITSLDRSKIAVESDLAYYASPRLVTHADEAWISRLKALYQERIPEDAVILDLMGSHVSHLPEDTAYSRVDVHGMNQVELQQNPAVLATGGRWFVHDLNSDPVLSFVPSASYDAVLCALGVQYLEEPERVLAEVGRVLKPSGVVIVSFSSNLFYEKALTGWIERGMKGRSRLVKDYLRAAGGYEEIEEIGAGGASGILGTLASILPGGAAGDPFGAVVGIRSGNE